MGQFLNGNSFMEITNLMVELFIQYLMSYFFCY